MQDVSLDDQDYRLWVVLLHTRHAIYKARTRELRRFGISPIEASVLFSTQVNRGTVALSELSRCLLREPHSVSQLITRMEKKGLVRKVKDLDRKNLVSVVMTEKGQQAYDQSTGREAIHYVMSSLSEEERQQLSSCLEKLLGKAAMELGMDYPSLP